MEITTILLHAVLVSKNKIMLQVGLEFWLEKNYFCRLNTTTQ